MKVGVLELNGPGAKCQVWGLLHVNPQIAPGDNELPTRGHSYYPTCSVASGRQDFSKPSPRFSKSHCFAGVGDTATSDPDGEIPLSPSLGREAVDVQLVLHLLHFLELNIVSQSYRTKQQKQDTDSPNMEV